MAASRTKNVTAAAASAARRLVVTVFILGGDLLVFFFLFVHAFELERIRGHDLEVGAALHARDDIPLVDLLGIDVEIGFTFGAQDHWDASFSLPGRRRDGARPSVYLESLAAA